MKELTMATRKLLATRIQAISIGLHNVALGVEGVANELAVFLDVLLGVEPEEPQEVKVEITADDEDESGEGE